MHDKKHRSHGHGPATARQADTGNSKQ